MASEDQSLTLTEGETTIVRFTLTDAQGAALDVTGAAFRWGYATALGTAPLIEKSGPFFTIIDGPAGEVDMSLGASDLASPGTFFHELEMTLQGKTEIVSRGILLVKPRILPAT